MDVHLWTIGWKQKFWRKEICTSNMLYYPKHEFFFSSPFCQLARMCRFMMKLILKFALKHKILRWQGRLMYGPALLASFTIGVLMWYTRTLTCIYIIRTSFIWLVHKLIFINCNLQILKEPKMASKIFLPFLLLLCFSFTLLVCCNGALVDDQKVFFIIPLFLQVLYLKKRFRF